MEKQYTVKLTKQQIDVLELGLTVLKLRNQGTVGMLAGDPEYQGTVARCLAEMDTADAVFTLLCRVADDN